MMPLNKSVEKQTSLEYGKFITTDMNEKFSPINKLIDDMHARLEEFQTMIHFANQERVSAANLLNSIFSNHDSLADLFARVDSVENLVDHIKCTLQSLEKDIEKTEEELGYCESRTSKVANILTPIFKKNSDKWDSPVSLQKYKTEDYFYSDDGTSTDAS